MSKIKTPEEFIEWYAQGKGRQIPQQEFMQAYHEYVMEQKIKELEDGNPYKEDIPHLGSLTQHHRGKYIGFMKAIEILKK